MKTQFSKTILLITTIIFATTTIAWSAPHFCLRPRAASERDAIGEKKELLITLPRRTSDILSAIYSIKGEGEYIVMKERQDRFGFDWFGRSRTEIDDFLTVYDVKTGMGVKRLEGSNTGYGYPFTITNTHMAVIYNSGGLIYWLTVYDLKTGNPVEGLEGLVINKFGDPSYILSDTHLAVRNTDGKYTVYDLKTGKPIEGLKNISGHEYALSSTYLVVVAYKDEGYIATVYDLRTGMPIRELRGNCSGDSHSGIISLTSTHLAVRDEHGFITVYDVNTGDPVENLKGLEANGYFSLTAAHLAVVNNSRLFVYDLKTGMPVIVSEGFSIPDDERLVYKKYSLTRTHLAVLNPSNIITVYDLRTGGIVKGLENADADRGHSLTSTHLEYTDSRGDVHVFDLYSQKLIPGLKVAPEFGPELAERFERGELTLETGENTLVLKSIPTAQATQLAQQLRQVVAAEGIEDWKKIAERAQQMAGTVHPNLVSVLAEVKAKDYTGVENDKLREEAKRLTTQHQLSPDEADVLKLCIGIWGQGSGEADPAAAARRKAVIDELNDYFKTRTDIGPNKDKALAVLNQLGNNELELPDAARKLYQLDVEPRIADDWVVRFQGISAALERAINNSDHTALQHLSHDSRTHPALTVRMVQSLVHYIQHPSSRIVHSKTRDFAYYDDEQTSSQDTMIVFIKNGVPINTDDMDKLISGTIAALSSRGSHYPGASEWRTVRLFAQETVTALAERKMALDKLADAIPATIENLQFETVTSPGANADLIIAAQDTITALAKNHVLITIDQRRQIYTLVRKQLEISKHNHSGNEKLQASASKMLATIIATDILPFQLARPEQLPRVTLSAI